MASSGNHNDNDNEISLALLVGSSDFFFPIIRGFNESCQEKQEDLQRMPNGNNKLSCHIHEFVGTCQERLLDLQSLVGDYLPSGLSGLAMNTGCKEPEFVDYMRSLTTSSVSPLSLVTYQKDLPRETGRVAYVGTDGEQMGRTLARLLRQLHPEGGTCAVVAPRREDTTNAFLAEIFKYNHLPGRPHWHLVAPLKNVTADEYYEQVQNYSLLNPTAIVTLQQTPMRHPNWTTLVKEHRHRNITYIGTDAADFQLDYLQRGYADGLVGQMPYEIGAACFQAMYQDAMEKRGLLPAQSPSRVDYRVETNLISYNMIPLNLPTLDVDQNLLGPLAILGWVLFGIIACSALFCLGWTLRYRRESQVVRLAQPEFLIMIAVGVLLMSASLIPLSYENGDEPTVMFSMPDGADDGDTRTSSHTYQIGICMSVPWLSFTGFTIVFSALFAKTWRVNRIYFRHRQGGSQSSRERATVPPMSSMLKPFATLLACNWAILLAWTLWDPLEYRRMEHEGTDYWNRVLSTYGACRSSHEEGALVYLVPLSILNLAVLLLSGWQAFRARNVASEFSEATYIALTIVSLCQAFMTGIPVIALVRDAPRAFFMMISLTIFLLCMAILGFIFVPKMVLHQQYSPKSPSEQANMMRRGQAANAARARESLPDQQVEDFSSWPTSGFPSDTSDAGSPNQTHSSSFMEDSGHGYRDDRMRDTDLTLTSIPENQEASEVEEETEGEIEKE
eukprot:scaffold2205_cov167-Amphora_coffeaeformis.AAC.1